MPTLGPWVEVGGPYEYRHSPQAKHLSKSTLLFRVQNLQDQTLKLAVSFCLIVPQASHVSAKGCNIVRASAHTSRMQGCVHADTYMQHVYPHRQFYDCLIRNSNISRKELRVACSNRGTLKELEGSPQLTEQDWWRTMTATIEDI